MAFKLYECDSPGGLPLVEVPDGKYVYERLSPGTIAEADYYKTFRWVSKGKSKFANILVAKSKADPKGSMRLLRIRHTKKGLKKLLRDCKSGKLAEKRAKDIERIQDDLSSLSGLDEESILGTIILLLGGVMTIMAIVSKSRGGNS
jgi:hypothetical protein